MTPAPDIHPAIARRDVIVFDCHCVLCSGFARFVDRHDTPARFAFVIAQSALGEALYAHYGLKCSDYETNLVFLDGRLFRKLDALGAVMGRLGWPWRLLAALRMLPLPVQDWLYDRIARNRYRLFGRYDQCMVPDPGMKARFID